MFDFFYRFHNKPLGFNLFSRDTEDGTPSPPSSQTLLDNDSVTLLDNDNDTLID